MLKQYEKIGQRTFTLDELKHILSIEDQYKLYGHLKSRVILKAQEDLKKHTDIYFEFKEIKQGRAIHQIKFFIYTNKKEDSKDTHPEENTQTIIPEIEPSSLDSPLLLELTQRTRSWGIPKQKLKVYCEKYSKEYIFTRLQYVEHQINVKAKSGNAIANPGGYLHTIMGLDDWISPIEERKERELSKRRMITDLNQKKRQLKEEEKSLKTTLHNKEIEIIQALFAKDTAAKMAAIELAKNARMGSFDKNKTAEQNLENNFLFRVAVYNKAKELNPTLFEALHQEYMPLLKRVRQLLLSV